jgi:hypothetical protein
MTNEQQTNAEPAIEPIDADWRHWLTALFPDHFTRAFAAHHDHFWDWLWNIQLGQPPEPGAFIAIWPRGAGKSTNAEAACACFAARLTRRYGLYVSGTQAQADKHVQSVAAMLGADGIDTYYPDAARRKVNKYGHSQGWRRNRLHTESGFVLDALGLDVASRGLKTGDQRPDFLIIDDVDSKHDTASEVRRKSEVLTHTIIPAGSGDLAILGIQNLIHRNSVFAQLADTRAEFLLNRAISGPFPALRNFAYEQRGSRYYITSGDPTWEGQSVDDCERELNRIGPAAFEAECQQHVKAPALGAVFPQYNEVYHVITWTEFVTLYSDIARDRYGRPRIPPTWHLGRAQDWGTTIQHPCATVWLAKPTKGHHLWDSVFVYREMLFPEYPDPMTMEVSPLKVGQAIVDVERDWMEASRMVLSLMSHEATAALNTYNNDMPRGYKLQFSKWKPDRLAGIAQLQNYLQIIDPTRSHPFRPHLLGRPRLYLIVDDAQGQLIRDYDWQPAWERPRDRTHPACSSSADTPPAPGSTGWTIRQPVDARGLVRLRAELQAYHYPQTGDGVEKDRPVKIFDDVIDPLRALADHFFPRAAQMTESEAILQALPEHLHPENIRKAPPEQQMNLWLAHQTGTIQIRHDMQRPVVMGYREGQKARRRAAVDPEYAATHRIPERPEPTIVDYRTALKNKYRDKPCRIGPDGRPITPEQEFRDAFMEGFNKRY